MINNNLILFIVFSFTIVCGFAFNFKKKGKYKLHVNLLVILSTEAPPGGDPCRSSKFQNVLCRCFSKLDVVIGN